MMMMMLDDLEQKRERRGFKSNCKMPFCRELASTVIIVNGFIRGKYCSDHSKVISKYCRPGDALSLIPLDVFKEIYKK